MGGLVKRYRFENKGGAYRRRCDACHMPGNELYYARFEEGGIPYWLHPGNCFYKAQKNYIEKMSKGIMPEIPKQPEIENEIITTSNEDNIGGEY